MVICFFLFLFFFKASKETSEVLAIEFNRTNKFKTEKNLASFYLRNEA